MKKLKFLPVVVLLVSITMFSSCYTYTFSVGEGAKSNEKVTKMNPYFVFGLAPGNVSDPNEMAGGAKDYEVTIQHTFVDGLLGAITFGIFTPTHTTVQK